MDHANACLPHPNVLIWTILDVWQCNYNIIHACVFCRERLHIANPDVPISTHEGSVVDSRSDQFLLFTHSDINADAAQTTIPFLDAQPVAPDPPTLLAGAGIYHKGRPGFGGFIGPKVLTYDFNTHIQAIFPVTEDEVNWFRFKFFLLSQ